MRNETEGGRDVIGCDRCNASTRAEVIETCMRRPIASQWSGDRIDAACGGVFEERPLGAEPIAGVPGIVVVAFENQGGLTGPRDCVDAVVLAAGQRYDRLWPREAGIVAQSFSEREDVGAHDVAPNKRADTSGHEAQRSNGDAVC